MDKELEFQRRTGYEGALPPVLDQLTSLYGIGDYVSHSPVLMGYEDFNLKLETGKGKYFVKMFATFRTDEECRNYTGIIEKVLQAGVSHPTLYIGPNGPMFELPVDGKILKGCVLQFLEGQSFYETGFLLTSEEMREIVRQAAKINTLDIQRRDMYDSWAIPNFLTELEKNRHLLTPEDLILLDQIAVRFSTLDLNSLPQSLVHGDIIKTNVLKTNDGRLYVLDFSVSDSSPRIKELAVLFCNLLFDEKNPESFPEFYRLGLEEYQKTIPLSPQELSALPVFVQAAHAMHVICPTHEKIVNGVDNPENEYWLNLGKIGLKYTVETWQS